MDRPSSLPDKSRKVVQTACQTSAMSCSIAAGPAEKLRETASVRATIRPLAV